MREKKPPYEDLSTMRILELVKKNAPPTFKNKEENSDEMSKCIKNNIKIYSLLKNQMVLFN